jgi:hypothetical protein
MTLTMTKLGVHEILTKNVVLQRRMKPSDFHHVNVKIFENRQFLREIKLNPVLKLLGQLTNSFLKPPTNNL